jgi:hypothetical protein
MKIFKMMTQRTNKDGKKFYQEIGTMFEGEYQGKPSLSGYLNTNPDVKVYFFEQLPKEQKPPQEQPPVDTSFDMEQPY